MAPKSFIYQPLLLANASLPYAMSVTSGSFDSRESIHPAAYGDLLGEARALTDILYPVVRNIMLSKAKATCTTNNNTECLVHLSDPLKHETHDLTSTTFSFICTSCILTVFLFLVSYISILVLFILLGLTVYKALVKRPNAQNRLSRPSEVTEEEAGDSSKESSPELVRGVHLKNESRL